MPRKTPQKKVERESAKPAVKKVKKVNTASSSRSVAKATEKPQIPVEEKKIESTPVAPVNTSVKIHKSTVFIAIGIILLGAILYFGRGFFVAAVVNGQPISRLALVREAERESGKQSMNSLIRNALIQQEARKENIKVTDKEIDNQIKTVENNLAKQGQNMDQVLSMEGMTRDDLKRIISLDLIVSKIVGKDIKITDKEVNDYIEKNKESLPKNQSAAQLKNTVKEQLKQEQLPLKAQSWLSKIEKEATIIKFVNY